MKSTQWRHWSIKLLEKHGTVNGIRAHSPLPPTTGLAGALITAWMLNKLVKCHIPQGSSPLPCDNHTSYTVFTAME